LSQIGHDEIAVGMREKAWNECAAKQWRQYNEAGEWRVPGWLAVLLNNEGNHGFKKLPFT
jgi:hypothetical protein